LLRERTRDILRFSAECRAVAQHVVGPLRTGIKRRPRHGKDFPSRFGSESRGDERARPARRLDDDNRSAKASDDAVTAGKVASTRLPSERHFADRRALFDDEFKQGFMFGRVNFSQTTRKDGDCAGFCRCLMRLGIDPAREAGDDDMPRTGDSARKLGREC
jgi:hypothetical protein